MIVQNKTAGNYAIRDLDIVLKKGQVLNLDIQIAATLQRKSKHLKYAIEKGHVAVIRRERANNSRNVVTIAGKFILPDNIISRAILVENIDPSTYDEFIMKDALQQKEIVLTTENLKLLGTIVDKNNPLRDTVLKRFEKAGE